MNIRVLGSVTLAVAVSCMLCSCKTSSSYRSSSAYRTSCVTPEYNVRLAPGALPQTAMTAPLPGQAIYHVAAPGETVWRISKMYGANVDDVMRANNLKTPQQLEIGQRLVIPAAQTATPRPVVSLYPSDKWQYIIIHHSATDEGNALEFNKAHNTRGFQGIGYHFVIDNGSKGKADGMIETSPRWTKQLEGAHCVASGMNHRGIGICLVGNFSQDSVSPKQMASLVYLVNTLREYYKIPAKRILGHGQVYGAKTECPGDRFPWSSFFRKLDDEKRGI